jgi:hypothetical protein
MDLVEQKEADSGDAAAAEPAAAEQKGAKKKRKATVHVDAAAMTQRQYTAIVSYLRWKKTKTFVTQAMPGKLSADLGSAFGTKANFISEHQTPLLCLIGCLWLFHCSPGNHSLKYSLAEEKAEGKAVQVLKRDCGDGLLKTVMEPALFDDWVIEKHRTDLGTCTRALSVRCGSAHQLRLQVARPLRSWSSSQCLTGAPTCSNPSNLRSRARTAIAARPSRPRQCRKTSAGSRSSPISALALALSLSACLFNVTCTGPCTVFRLISCNLCGASRSAWPVSAAFAYTLPAVLFVLKLVGCVLPVHSVDY